ncbi:phospholipase A2 inhibitor NAI-like [Mauremys mutica]|uniref:phospholipase A2 inhibitor NAI-like n=1 Tax=Mauremys mutica TaxID=74926 RepID=UPI001D16B1D4|nr:phospholipase A2 inhibitor NAI-like [Mauremys mutica]XP_044846596.1 phospholipase A2 inhibitor NAI-like [Mauremys mutica]
MEASLAACILAALLATGSCLQCEVCTELGTSCSGTVQTCSAGLDSCGITLIEQTLAGLKQQVIAKACISSDRCNLGPLTMNFGNGVTMKQGIACCVGDACRTTTVTVPPADPKPNGRRCPACVAVLSAQCNEGIIDCTGAETRCIEVAGTITIGNFHSIIFGLFFLCSSEFKETAPVFPCQGSSGLPRWAPGSSALTSLGGTPVSLTRLTRGVARRDSLPRCLLLVTPGN